MLYIHFSIKSLVFPSSQIARLTMDSNLYLSDSRQQPYVYTFQRLCYPQSKQECKHLCKVAYGEPKLSEFVDLFIVKGHNTFALQQKQHLTFVGLSPLQHQMNSRLRSLFSHLIGICVPFNYTPHTPIFQSSFYYLNTFFSVQNARVVV